MNNEWLIKNIKRDFLYKIPRKYEILLSKSDSDLLQKKCRLMMVTPEEYVANLIAINVRPNDGGFRILTKSGLLIDSKGKSIDEYLDEILSE